jgi:hypothetical protein
MPTIVTCPDETCARQLRVPDELLGKSVKCPKCGKIFTAREDSGAAAPPPPPRPVEEEYEREEEDRDEERRPRRRSVSRDDDDYEDDRPRRRRRRRDYVPHRGTMILVFGILAVVGVVWFVFGPMAWIMGNQDLQEIRAGRMDPEGEGNTSAGRVCGMIATILWGVLTGGCCLVYIFAFAVTAGAAGGRFH